jgi:hypothetical protein
MRTSTLAILSALFVSFTACKGGDAEVCDDNADNDGDGQVDCTDSECSADASCDEADADTDADADADSDADSDSDADPCADDPTLCDEFVGVIELGTATADVNAYTGTGSLGWEAIPADATTFIDPAKHVCEVTFDTVGEPSEADLECVGCDWAFKVTFSNTAEQTGENCTDFDLHDQDSGDALNVDGTAYEYGYNPAYDDGENEPYGVLMYYSADSDGNGTPAWFPISSDVTNTGTSFAYAYIASDLYYY